MTEIKRLIKILEECDTFELSADGDILKFDERELPIFVKLLKKMDI